MIRGYGGLCGAGFRGTTTNRTTNSGNQITAIGSATVGYDANGNVIYDDHGDTLVYDAWNRPGEVKFFFRGGQRGFGRRLYLRWTWTHDERNRWHHHD